MRQILVPERVLPPPRLIAVDVDQTLIGPEGQVHTRLIEWLLGRKSAGFRLMLWSMMGKEHAESAVKLAGVEGLFDTVESKPGFIVDDDGWAWIRRTVIVRKFH